MTQLVRLLALIVTCLAFASGAMAGCDITGIQSVSPATLNVGTYTATATPPPTTIAVTLTVTKTGNGNGNCQGGFAMLRSAPPVQMTRQPPGPVALPYAITASGSSVLYFAGGNPTIVPFPNFHAPSGNATGSVTVVLTITPQTPVATPPVGIYLDQLALRVYNRQSNSYAFVGQLPLTISASVVHSCTLVTPNSMSLNFSADVATGIPAGATQSTSFNVNCSGPSRVQLTSSALVKTPAVSGNAVFDAMINFRAVASYGGTSATLITSGTTPVTVISPAATTLFGSNVPVNLGINLIPGRPLLGGSNYSGVLHVSVDPTL